MAIGVKDAQLQQWWKAIEAEEKEEKQAFRMDGSQGLRALKAAGLAIHPFKVTKKQFGYADYPELSFYLPYPVDTQSFRDGAAIEIFYEQETPIQGQLLDISAREGRIRLFAPDYPDWIESGAGFKLAPDTHTTEWMKKGLIALEKNKQWYPWFLFWSGQSNLRPGQPTRDRPENISANSQLNTSQQAAVQKIASNENIVIVHGPPGTGKSTTLLAAIELLIARGEKILVSAPSNAAVDHLARGLVQKQVAILRVGNTGKIQPDIFPHTIEARLNDPAIQKQVKTLRKQAEAYRSMALKYKRSFGKAEREQRQLLFAEVKKIRQEIRQMQSYEEEKMLQTAQVVLGTPVAIKDAAIHHVHFHQLILDEAGQCLAPLAMMLLPLADKWVLAGDHLQLPPTVISQTATQLGLQESILAWITRHEPAHLLHTQYRMRAAIAGFSSDYFYQGALQTPAHLYNDGLHIHFIDTAGAGMDEKAGKEGSSLENPGELSIIAHLHRQGVLSGMQTGFISPYSAQVEAAKGSLPANWRISTIDSFQGQESDQIIISLVRSNEDGQIGFLRDYRRMNVALTRARQQLWIIGDSATLARDGFYDQLLQYVQTNGDYQTVWELGMEW
jgi:ATP-dependent RNA/DNA helicase IGHMBP2